MTDVLAFSSSSTAKRSAPRNLVICCDGTSNEPAPMDKEAGGTNVVRLFRCMRKGEAQIVYYDPGIGTEGILDLWHRRSNRVRALAEQASGYGLDHHVTQAYRFICEHYRPGDRIWLFGFSRGAYTARVVAGLLHQVGLLRAEQANLADFVLKAYKESSDSDDLSIGWQFARAVGSRTVTIHFLGLWDTVGSMIAPLKDRIGFGLTHLPYTRQNPSVARIRHAMAIDERRRMFRLSQWHTTDFVANRFDTTQTTPQDVQQVWFAGAHGDVGGGHAEAQSGLSKLSLAWMAGEAAAAGLRIDKAVLTKMVNGHTDKNGNLVFCKEDPDGPIHFQPAGGWWILEYWPKRAKWREWAGRGKLLGWYFPAGEPRPIAPRDMIHESVVARMTGGYAPMNLGNDASRYQVSRTNVITAPPAVPKRDA
jgi:uncharacterized protein (DUF2235 family)